MDIRAGMTGFLFSGTRSVARWAALCMATLLVIGGCAGADKDAADTVRRTLITAQTPIIYGVVSKVDSAEMVGKGVRKGDLAITVDLDAGGAIMVIQSEDDIYTVGDRVRLFRDKDGFTRIQVR